MSRVQIVNDNTARIVCKPHVWVLKAYDIEKAPSGHWLKKNRRYVCEKCGAQGVSKEAT